MQRYFANFNNQDASVVIKDGDVHHIKNVMRMKIGDAIYLSNQQLVFYSVITSISDDEVICGLQYEIMENSELGVHVTIAQGLPKADKFEWIIQKTTELGVSKLIPISSERSIIKLDPKKKQKKIDRYQKIAKEASEQSHRTLIPTVSNVMTVKELIEESKSYTYKAVAYEATTEVDYHNFDKIMQEIKPQDSLIVFIGPEGGISNKEMTLLTENGFKIISLGNRILRTETAPIFVMSAVVYQLEVKG